MKKFIGIFIAVVFLLGSQTVSAATPFNGQAGDCPDIGIGNYTTQVGIADGQWGCWSTQNVTANAGDVINVAIFYHNNTNQTLTNVGVSMSQLTTGSSTSHTFSGMLNSDQGSKAVGPVTVNLNTPQTLTFSSAYWFDGKYNVDNDIDIPLAGSNLINGGVNLGSVAPGWNDYGYILAVFNVGNSTTSQCNISNFQANPTNVNAGDSATLTWNSTGCSSFTVNGVSANSGYVVSPSNTTTYTLNAFGSNGSDIESTTVFVNTVVPQCNVSNFQANPTNVNAGDSATLTWNSTGCSSFTVNGVSANSGYVVSPSNTTTYTLNAFGSNGSDIESTTVFVNTVVPQCQIYNFRTDRSDNRYNVGDLITFSWNTNAPTITISGIANTFNSTGTTTTSATTTNTNYTLRAEGPNCNTSTRQLYVYVDQNNNNVPTISTYSPTKVTDNSATISGYVNNNSGNRADAWLEFPCNGTQYGNQYNITNGNLSANIYNLNPNTSYSYCAVARNYNGQVYRGNTVSFITSGSTQPNFSVATTIATNIQKTTAILNGLITNNNSSVNSYFEYGSTVNLGYKTSSRNVTVGPVNASINGLIPNTIYFFRNVAEGPNGIVRGTIEVFRTLSDGSKPVVVQGKTVIGEESPIMLKIENRYEYIQAGDIVDYVVAYKNIGENKLTQPVLQVVIPKGFTFENASRGEYEFLTDTLTVPLEDLDSEDEGEVYIRAKVNSILKDRNQIVTSALLVYTNPNEAQENAIAYVINIPRENNSLGAAALFGNWLPGGLLFWLLIITIILVIILIVRTYRNRKPIKQSYNSNEPTNIH
ncbi:MAG: hypothetical protein U9R00_01010 [Patescibacteria group bacterium]|nr:hypothetical protein [Patescibacteria group bacterium]